jgi:hypothetical protein
MFRSNKNLSFHHTHTHVSKCCCWFTQALCEEDIRPWVWVWVLEDDDELVTSFILVGLCLPVRGERERVKFIWSHILRNIHQVLLWPGSSFCFGTSCHNISSCFLLNCCYFELWPCHKGRGGGEGGGRATTWSSGPFFPPPLFVFLSQPGFKAKKFGTQ